MTSKKSRKELLDQKKEFREKQISNVNRIKTFDNFNPGADREQDFLFNSLLGGYRELEREISRIDWELLQMDLKELIDEMTEYTKANPRACCETDARLAKYVHDLQVLRQKLNV